MSSHIKLFVLVHHSSELFEYELSNPTLSLSSPLWGRHQEDEENYRSVVIEPTARRVTWEELEEERGRGRGVIVI